MKSIVNYIDHTLLQSWATKKDIQKLCEEAKRYRFKSVCVNPYNVAFAVELLKDTPINVCTTIGFPLGATTPEIKAQETSQAEARGAKEFDMVINVGALKAGDYDLVKKDIEGVVQAAKGKIVKVIIETMLLTEEEKVKACQIAKQAGAKFVKTCSGFTEGGATVEDIRLMRQSVGAGMEVKASGKIRSLEKALALIEAGATRLGVGAGVEIAEQEKMAQKQP